MMQNLHLDYDPNTLFHYLWWRELCGTATPSGFQSLFERVAGKLRPDFMRVRPYGQLGDRKCDGLYFGDGTVFQVYSPDELKQSDTIAKIEEDFAGAVREWNSQLKKWVFVYNTRRGLGPDIPRMLAEQQSTYPGIVIEPLSSEALWEMMRGGLTLQQRCEILGPPPGYGNLFMLPSAAAEDVQQLLEAGRIAIIQDVLSPIDVRDAVAAMAPDLPFGPAVSVGLSWPPESWTAAVNEQERVISDLLARSRAARARFAVFSLAPVPLAVHLGCVLSDRVDAELFHYDREKKTWRWEEGRTSDDDIRVQWLPAKQMSGRVEAIVRVSLSAAIRPQDSVAAAGDQPLQVEVSVANPDVTWLGHPSQVAAIERTFREALQDLNRRLPDCRRIHLFYAGPAAGAVAIGRAINPRMDPEIALYEYTRSRTPRYEHVLTLGAA